MAAAVAQRMDFSHQRTNTDQQTPDKRRVVADMVGYLAVTARQEELVHHSSGMEIAPAA